MTSVAILFWAGAALVFYTYLGYGILLWGLVRLREAIRPARREGYNAAKEGAAEQGVTEHSTAEHAAADPEVTLLIAAYNEQEIVAAKMENCRALEYMPGRLHIVWITDGSTDDTPARLAAYPEVTVLHQARRGGKTAALNRALEQIATPLVVFTDANTMLNAQAVREIVRCFDDPAVGCVAGEKRVAAAENTGENAGTRAGGTVGTETGEDTNRRTGENVGKNAGTKAGGTVDAETGKDAGRGTGEDAGENAGTRAGETVGTETGEDAGRGIGENAGKKTGTSSGAAATEGVYWKYESKLKELDYRLHSAVGAAGELFAVRRELFGRLAEDTLLDDFVCSMRIAAKGYKIAYCKEAYALETPSADMGEEGKRKQRIAAGGLQSVWRLRGLLNPFRYGVLWFQYVSHRVLRWTLTPVALIALVPLNTALLWSRRPVLYAVLLALQAAFYLAAAAGWIQERRGRRGGLWSVPYYFLFMNLNVFRGAWYLATHREGGTWEKARRA